MSKKSKPAEELEFIEEYDAVSGDDARFGQAVLFTTDWTVETVLAQLERKNIDLNPRFQRRDAWSIAAKSKYVESIVLGLPIPQIVLAEKKGERGKYIVSLMGSSDCFRCFSLRVKRRAEIMPSH